MLKKTDKVIDGMHVSTVQLPAIRAHRLFWRLGKVAPFVMARIDLSKLSAEMSVAALAPALLELFGRLSVEESESLLREILCATSATVDGRSIELSTNETIDHVFSGKLGALYATVAFALGANFGDFISGVIADASDTPGNAGNP